MQGSTPLPLSESRLETRVDWLHAPEPWVVFLVIVPAVLLVFWWIYRAEVARMRPWTRWSLLALRALVALAIIAFLFEPILVRERVRTESSTILALIDDSFSMGIADRYGDAERQARVEEAMGQSLGDSTTRLDQVRAVLERPELGVIDELRHKGNVRVVSFSNELRVVAELPRLGDGESHDVAELDLAKVAPRGKVTRIGDALYDAVNELRGENVSAVVLFSDGRDNGGIIRPEEAADRLRRREIPVHAVGVGNPDEPKDIRVFGIDVAEVVLEKDVVPVDFNVVSKGFEGQVQVKLRLIGDDGGELRPTMKFVQLRGDDEPQSFRIEFRPRRPGEYTVRVEIPPREGELFRDNNFDERRVTVLADRIKLLYVEGPPRYEYRYLQHALTRDPTMEAHILLTSADPRYVQSSSAGLPPIDRFPTRREELFEYHVVIIGDVDPGFFTRRQREWLVEFVDDVGGGVIFIAGVWNIPQKLRGDPLEKLLPVVLEDAEPNIYGAANIERDFQLSLTPEGRQHPVMQLLADPDRNQRLWEAQGGSARLPGMYWYARVKSLRRGALALAVHATEQDLVHGPRPIFAYQYHGRGRTFISLTDETWRWRRGVGNRYFYRFWGQVVRFVSAGRLLGQRTRFSISTDQREYTLGADVQVLARLLDERYKPLKVEEYEVHHRRVDPPGEGVGLAQAVQTPGRPEFFEAHLDASDLGEHEIWIEDHEKQVASATYRVVVPQVEYAEPRMDRGRLEKVARLSGGSYRDLPEVAELTKAITPYEREVAVPAENTPLWDSSTLLLLVVGLLTAEWLLRKAVRLV